MIAFFRKIRQTLLSEGKTRKYFTYAIGEIILVVIGILIALQINNWNEERKLRLEERELLTNLSVSFSSKLTELEDKNESRSESIENINRLLIRISNPDYSISDEDMYVIIGQLFTWYTVNEEFSVIDMLFSSGKINTISNDTLKARLISWPDAMEEMLEEQREVQALVMDDLIPVIDDYASTATRSNIFFPEYAPDSLYLGSPYPDDFDGLYKDRKFESLIAQKKIYLIVNVRDTEILIENAKKILALIGKELSHD